MFFILNNVDKHEEVNVNPRPSAKSRSSALSSVLCWAFVTLMNECSDKKRVGGRWCGGGGVELSGHIMGWGHVLQWQLCSWNKTCMPLPTTQQCCISLALKELGRSCCALEHHGLWELPEVCSRDKRKTFNSGPPLVNPCLLQANED